MRNGFRWLKSPKLIFDHDSMLHMAQQELRYQAASILFCLNCSPKNSRYPSYKIFMKVCTKRVSTTAISAVRFCQLNY